MFRLIDATAPELVEIEFDGAAVSVPAGISLAAVIYYLDAIPARRTLLSDSPRAPFCMMGVCFECLLEIDGVDNQRACQVEVKAGMRVRRQLAVSVGEVT
jgi:predicted molibdopterin-dependent oxidoreductase YjgC